MGHGFILGLPDVERKHSLVSTLSGVFGTIMITAGFICWLSCCHISLSDIFCSHTQTRHDPANANCTSHIQAGLDLSELVIISVPDFKVYILVIFVVVKWCEFICTFETGDKVLHFRIIEEKL